VDCLSPCRNRLTYEQQLEQEIARYKRFAIPLVLAVWDVDHFKNVNDSVEQWFEPANNALYRTKQEGRNRCEVAQL